MNAADIAPLSLVNPEAEAALLGSAMGENAGIDPASEIVSVEDFSVPLNGRIWAAIVRERAAGRHAGPIALKGYFDGDEEIGAVGGLPYLARLASSEAGMLVPAVDLAKQIRELAVRRKMRSGLIESANRCADLVQTVGEIVSDVDATIRAPADNTARSATAGECMDAYIASLDDPETGVTCGVIPDLDDLIGVLRPGSMTIIAGRPGMGKTGVALTYARGAAQLGHGVQIFSHEMSGTDLVGRTAADMCFDLHPSERVPYKVIQSRRLNEQQRKNVRRAAQHVHTLPISIVDTGSITIGRIKAMVRSQKRKLAAAGQALSLVIIDYLQLVHPDRPGKSNYEAVSEVSRGLKALAMDEQVAVVALAQLSRSVEQRPDKRPQLSDLRDSGQIEQDADAVLFLLRMEYYQIHSEPDPGDQEAHEKWASDLRRVEGVIEFILAKRRNGSTGNAYGRYYGAFQAVRGSQ